jgi:3-methyl-2-oxobutanoate hydroxymethyltransferase
MTITSTVTKRVRVPDLALMKERGERIVMLTAYDATMTRLLDRAGIDVLLVGDSLGQVVLGLDSTVPVTLDAMTHHTRAVTRAANRALVVADMPFLTYQVTAEEAMRHAARLFQEGGAAAVKLEGGRRIADTGAKDHCRRSPGHGTSRAHASACPSAGRNAATGAH